MHAKKRKARDPEFAKDFDTGYEQIKIGVLLKQAREEENIFTLIVEIPLTFWGHLP